MKYNFIKEEDIIIVKLEGEFILEKTNNFIKIIFDKIEDDITTIIIDFSNVKFIDSSGIGQLITLFKELHKRGISIKFCSLNNTMKNIFKKLKVFSFFEIYDNCDEALAYL